MNETGMKNALATTGATKPPTIFEAIEAQKPAIVAAFGASEERYAVAFIRQARTLMQINPTLQLCTQESLLGAMMLAAQLKLQLNPGLNTAFLVPYAKSVKLPNGEWGKKYEAQFQIGYGGYLELFYRHEKSVSLDVYTVYKGDDFAFSLGTDAKIHHVPNLIDQGEAYAWYAVAHLEGGHQKFLVMSRNQIMANAMKSQAWDAKAGAFKDKSSWATDFDSMARKTVIKMLAKTLPLSTEINLALSQDGVIKSQRPGVNVIDADDETYNDYTPPAELPAPDPAPAPVQKPEPKPSVEVKVNPAPTQEPKQEEIPLPDESSAPQAQSAPPVPQAPADPAKGETDLDTLNKQLELIFRSVGELQQKDPLFTKTQSVLDEGDVFMGDKGVTELKTKYMASVKQVNAIKGMLSNAGKTLLDVAGVENYDMLTKAKASQVFKMLEA